MIVESLSLLSLTSLSTMSSSLQSRMHLPSLRTITFPAMNSLIDTWTSSIASSYFSSSFIIENVQDNDSEFNFFISSLKLLSSLVMEKISPNLTDSIRIYIDDYENFGTIAITAISIIMIMVSFNTSNNNNYKMKTPYKVIGVYNPDESKAYFDERSDLFIKRFFEIAILSSSFGSKYLFDYVTNKIGIIVIIVIIVIFFIMVIIIRRPCC